VPRGRDCDTECGLGAVYGGGSGLCRSDSVRDLVDAVVSCRVRCVEMPCSCAPTTHAGSFRCGMHRSHSWNGRGTIYRSGEDLELSTVSLIENSLCEELQKQSLRKAPAGALPPLARSPGVSRSPPKGTSRLRHVVSSSDEEDDVKPAFPIG